MVRIVLLLMFGIADFLFFLILAKVMPFTLVHIPFLLMASANFIILFLKKY